MSPPSMLVQVAVRQASADLTMITSSHDAYVMFLVLTFDLTRTLGSHTGIRRILLDVVAIKIFP